MIKNTIYLIIFLTIIGVAFYFFTLMSPSESDLVNAAARNDLEGVSKMLEEGHDINGWGGDSWTSLTIASQKGHLEMVKLLVEKGADINKVTPGGTALDWALYSKQEEVAEFLVSHDGECHNMCDLLQEPN